MITKETHYIFYLDNGKVRRYLKRNVRGGVDTTILFSEADKLSNKDEVIRDLYKEKFIRKKLAKNFKLGYVRIVTKYEFKEVEGLK